MKVSMRPWSLVFFFAWREEGEEGRQRLFPVRVMLHIFAFIEVSFHWNQDYRKNPRLRNNASLSYFGQFYNAFMITLE